ncbi:hypothetical protein LP414_19805 [Polaromonas sp. P1(28)-13]|nr:hypothetical protein LP414_19805 [Polaromonas sp. P1(28)-13]
MASNTPRLVARNGCHDKGTKGDTKNAAKGAAHAEAQGIGERHDDAWAGAEHSSGGHQQEERIELHG